MSKISLKIVPNGGPNHTEKLWAELKNNILWNHNLISQAWSNIGLQPANDSDLEPLMIKSNVQRPFHTTIMIYIIIRSILVWKTLKKYCL